MDHESPSHGLGALAAPRRNNYFYGKLMDVHHFEQEQTYGNRKRWLLNRLSLGEGVLHGLEVEADGSLVRVGPGMAIDGMGREIIVPRGARLDPWQLVDACGAEGDKLSVDLEHTVRICLAYRECAADYVPVLVTDCNAKEASAPGTIVESYCLLVQEGEPDPMPKPLNQALCQALAGQMGGDESPPTPARRRRLLCQAKSDESAKLPDSPCVTLAVVRLAAGGTIGGIDSCTARPAIYSNEMLLELILCLAERLEQCCAADGAPEGDTQ